MSLFHQAAFPSQQHEEAGVVIYLRQSVKVPYLISAETLIIQNDPEIRSLGMNSAKLRWKVDSVAAVAGNSIQFLPKLFLADDETSALTETAANGKIQKQSFATCKTPTACFWRR
ncbi:hypothetical protein COCON_G00029550 [Conger conger]|uniref:Uncharacterized protein n=1 Tax=Conger conger TaxID=82655 RepID=A0A9Q1DYF7_CONCO|nr:hypothetical protein COCON_G00029550 [Conger conger]